MKKLVKYLKGVRAELMRVRWPSRSQVFKLTVIVILMTTIVALYLGALDLIFAKIFGILIR